MLPTTNGQAAVLEYLSEYGSFLGPGLPVYYERFQVDLQAEVGFLEVHQPWIEEGPGGDPLGNFKATLPHELGAALRRGVESTDLDHVPRSARREDGMNFETIRVQLGAEESRAHFVRFDDHQSEYLNRLVGPLDEAKAYVAKHPLRALVLEIHPLSEPSGAIFEVRIQNVGSDAAVIPGAGMLKAESRREMRESCLGIRVAHLRTGAAPGDVRPLEWSRLDLDLASAPSAPVLLRPGEVTSFESPLWVPPERGGRYIAQAMFAYYGEPSIVDGREMIRGRAESKRVQFVAPASAP